MSGAPVAPVLVIEAGEIAGNRRGIKHLIGALSDLLRETPVGQDGEESIEVLDQDGQRVPVKLVVRP
jgi:hypothetical protein